MRPTSARFLAAAAVLLAVPGAAAAQDYANQPFVRDPAGIARAAALARIFARAEASAEAYSRAEADDDDAAPPEAAADESDDDDEGGEGLAFDLSLVRATLAATDPAAAAALDTAAAPLLAEADADAAEALATAAERARAALFPDPVPADVTAAVIAELLLDEGGVTESYEEAVAGEAEAYAVGRTALASAGAMWAELRPATDADAADEVDAAFARLGTLFPAGTPTLSPDPEEAEAHAHAVVGALEVATNAELYPGRDLGRAVEMVAGLAKDGCRRRADGAAALGTETLTIAAAYYERTLAPTLTFVAADAAGEIAGALDDLGDDGPEACETLAAGLAAALAAVRP